MPQIILKINSSADKIYDSDKICCYLINPDVPLDKIAEATAIGKPVLMFNTTNAIADGCVVDVDSSLPIKTQIRPIREKIGNKKILGTIIEPSRHEAMLASETEPEFVAFRVTRENLIAAHDVIDWYNELFLIQSAADLSIESVDAKELNVDFVIINSQDYNDFSC